MIHGPGERRALVALLLLVAPPSLGAAAALWWWPGGAGPVLYALAKLWILVLPAAWWRWVDGRRWSASPVRRGGLGVGLLSGLVIGAAILVAWRAVGAGWVPVERLQQVAAENGFDSRGGFLLLAAWFCFVNAALEEYVWRWFAFVQFERLVGANAAVPAAALAFTLHHVVALRAYLPWDVTLLAAAGIFVGGSLWSLLYRRYRSVWPGYVSHLLVDVAVMAIGWELLFGT
jgi:hypothetical protein